jgi:hypothetical protein
MRGELFPTPVDGIASSTGRQDRESSVVADDRTTLTLRKGHLAALRLPDGTIGTFLDQKPKAMRRKKRAVKSSSQAGRTCSRIHHAEKQQLSATESCWHTWYVDGGRREIQSPGKNSRQRMLSTSAH